MTNTIVTSRLRLIEASPEVLRAELAGRAVLADELHAELPAEWPPPLFDEDAIQFALAGLASGEMTGGWGFYYVVLQERVDHPTAIGIGGFKGRPDPLGQVEVGYSILPRFQGQGYATEALQAWVNLAIASQVVGTIALDTLRGHEASIRVAEKVGFTVAKTEVVGHGAEVIDRYECRLPSFAGGADSDGA